MSTPSGPSVDRRAVLCAIGAGAVTTAWPGTVAAQEDEDALIPAGPRVTLERIAEGLTAPVGIEVAPEDRDRRFILDQPGQIYTHGPDGLVEEPFLDLSDRMVRIDPNFDERGLLGLAFHPEFAENGRFFIRYSAPTTEETPDGWSHTAVVAEFEADDDDRSTADPESERRLIEIPQPALNHNAGPLAFGPDGYLYITTGDGGDQYDVGRGHVDDWYDETDGGNGQNTTENLLGGILRIDVDADEDPYGIPPENPLAGTDEHLPEYFAWGMRNPWGIAFAEEELIAVDVAQDMLNRVNLVESGGNYGWNVREGTHCFDPANSTDPPETCPEETPESVRGGEPLRRPVIEYPQSYPGEPERSAVIGGHVYIGNSIPALEGGYVFGDWNGSLFVSFPPEGWPENDTPERDFAEQIPEGADEANLQEARWEGLWPLAELVVDDDEIAEDGRLGRRVLSIGQDDSGEIYVGTSEAFGPGGESGEVYRLAPPSDGEPGDETAENESTTDRTDASDDGEGPSDEDEEATSPIPGFGVLAGLVGLGGALARQWRQSDERETG